MLIPRLHRMVATIVIATAGVLGAAPSTVQAQAPKFTATVLQQVPLGELPGKWNMKATMVVTEPGAEIPFHVHKGPGLRYVLQGEVTIKWKDGKTETYKAGSTYFEGAGENHPAGEMAATNKGAVASRLVIIELVP